MSSTILWTAGRPIKAMKQLLHPALQPGALKMFKDKNGATSNYMHVYHRRLRKRESCRRRLLPRTSRMDSKPREAHALAIRSTHETHDHRSRVDIDQRRAGIASATCYVPEPAPQAKALTSARGGLASRAPRATFPNTLSRVNQGRLRSRFKKILRLL